jgi:hypothetical protein
MTRPDSIPRLTTQTIVYSKSGNSPEHDNLRLPNGKTIAESTTDEIRQIFGQLGIEGAHTDGRAIIVRRYHEFISGIYDAAGLRAVKEFLEERQNNA